MLSILKKPHGEAQPLEVVEIPLEPELPMQFLEVQESIEAKEIPTEPPKVEEVAETKNEENLMMLLETLKQEERSLLIEKQQLVRNEEQLRLRAIEEIEKSKARISGLKSEIPELKQKCQDIAKALETPVYSTSD